MAKLRLPYHTRFIDRQRNKKYQGPGTFDVPEDAVEHYKTRRWVEPDSESEQTGETIENEFVEEDSDTPEADPEKDYTRQELEDMSYEQLRTMASKSKREGVNGRSRKEDIVAAFATDDDPEPEESEGDDDEA